MTEDVCIDTFCDKLAPRVRYRNTLAKPSLSESFGQALQLPIVIAYAKVCIAGMVGVCGLGAVIIALGALS